MDAWTRDTFAFHKSYEEQVFIVYTIACSVLQKISQNKKL